MTVLIFFSFMLLSSAGYSQFNDSKKITHPTARQDGLTRIDAEGNYIYDEPQPLTNESFHIKLGYVDNPVMSVEIKNVNTNAVTLVHFDDMYDGASKLSLGLDYEYFLSNTAGRWGVQAGAAFQFAQGRGRLASNPDQESQERFTFVTVPLTLGLVYRFEYSDKQFFAPYVAGGGAYVGLVESRDDQSGLKAIGSAGFYGSGGVLVNLTAFSRELASEMRSEYEISQMWINLEFRWVNIESTAFTYDNKFIQGGISIDY